MRGWRRTAAVGLAALCLLAASCSGASATGPRQAAQTETRLPSPPDTELPLQTYGSMLVDPIHAHVFVTGGPGDPLVVVGYTGAIVAVLAAESGGGAMYLDGTTLYLARPSYGLLDAVDASTLRLIRSFPTAPILAPLSVTKAAGRIWISNQSPLQPELESLDPLSGATTPQPPTGRDLSGALEAVPAHPGTILVTEQDGTPGVDEVDVSTGVARVVASGDLAGGGAGPTVLSSDGQSFWVGDATPYGVSTYRPADLHPGAVSDGSVIAPDGSAYVTAAAAGGLAYLPASNQLAVGIPHAQGSDIEVFTLGDSRPGPVLPVAGQLSFDGVRAAPDRPLMFVVHAAVTSQGPTPPHFQVLDLAVPHPAVPDDFAMMVFPFSAATVTQGQSTSVSVAVGVSSGSYEPVSLSAHGLPAGVTATFNPPSGADTFTMTLTAGPDAPPGTTTVTVTGTTASVTHTTGLAVTVNARSDFAVRAYQANLDVVQGQSTTTALYAVGAAGSHQVTWSAANLPAGVTATFTPPAVAPGGTSNLTLTATSPGPGDTVSTPVTVTGTSAVGAHSLTVRLTVTALPVAFWQSLAAPPTAAVGAVAVTSWGPGRLDLFARGSDGALWHRFLAPGSGWSAWEDLGGRLAGAPAAVSSTFGRIDVFVRGNDNQLWHRWWDGTRWQSWEPLGGALTSAPAVASWAPGRLDVVAVGAGAALYHLVWAGHWSDWESRGGTCAGDPGIASPAFEQLDIFCLGVGPSTGQLWYQLWQGRWTGWIYGAPGAWTQGISATSATPGRVDVVGADGATQALGHDWFDGLRWHHEALDGALIAAPSAAPGPGAQITVVGLGPDGQIHQRTVG